MRVTVVGAGVTGLACAWRLAQTGATVTVFEQDPVQAASRVAAGMLAPLTEAQPTEPAVLAAGREALKRWPAFASELAASGEDPGYRRTGTLVTSYDTGDLAALDEFASRLDVEVERLTGSACRALEPALAPGVRGGLSIPGDHSVDNRALLHALGAACRTSGVRMVAAKVESLETIAADVVVVAAGAWVGRLLPAFADLVRPVRGEILRLAAGRHTPRLSRTVRAVVEGRAVYLVPRSTGELVVGATQDEVGFDRTVTAGGVHRLLADARRVLPAVDEYALVETAAGLRPVSRDSAPLVGRVQNDGAVVAAGHGRNGILLAPFTAELVCAAVQGDEPYPTFDPARFTRVSR